MSFIVACALMLTAIPGSAWAQDELYETPSVKEVAQIQTTGTMQAVEQRSFVLSGPFDAMRWNFTGWSGDSEVAVSQVRMAQIDDAGAVVGDWTTLSPVSFDSKWRPLFDTTFIRTKEALATIPEEDQPAMPKLGTWAFDTRSYALYVFFQQSADRLIFEVNYTVTNAVAAYDDVAEMYWDYTPARDDLTTRNVEATVQLPVPEGTQVTPGETVLAWGHGAAGEFDISAAGTVTFNVPEVPAGQYANAHILFPVSWLTNLTVEAKQAYSGTRQDDAVAEEEEWTDTWSSSVANELGVNIAVLAVCAAALAVAAGMYLAVSRRNRREQPVELTPAQVDALTADAAVLARFESWNHVGDAETDPDAVSERVRASGLFDMRSFRAQKRLAIAAVVFIACAVVALVVFGGWLAFFALLATGICMGVVANYIPRRTPKGDALERALHDRAPAGTAATADVHAAGDSTDSPHGPGASA